MAITVTSAVVDNKRWAPKFRTDASEVMGALRGRVADVLAELGNFSKPAEVQRALDLDKTLGRQVFKLACTADAMRSTAVIPSRTSMTRFLNAATLRGITGESVAGVWSAYEGFEKLVERHAGSRATFNLMASAASGSDEEWAAADAQHRRNAFRAMSHAMGIQAKTAYQLAIINEMDDGSQYELALILGHYELRVLHPLQRVRVFGQNMTTAADTADAYREPLGLSDAVDGHLLEDFCSKPLPKLSVVDRANQYGQCREIFIDEPEVGRAGTSNLLFGAVYRRLPALNQPLNIAATSNKPVEILLFDVLKKRSKSGPPPTGKATLSLGTTNEKVGIETVPLRGKYQPQFLGRGPACLSTPEIPHSQEMLSAIAARLKWDISDYDAWRIRVEFPITQSTVTIAWQQSDTVSSD